MSRLIDDDVLKGAINRETHARNMMIAAGDVLDIIDEQPTVDAVTVIRCRNRKYYNPEYCGEGCGWCERNGLGHGSFDDWFCADGESKENTELTGAIKEAGE